MATISPTRYDYPDGSYLYQWLLFTEADTCEPILHASSGDKTIHVYGTWDAATFVLQGSCDILSTGNYIGLHSAVDTTTISFTADSIESVNENPRWFKPVASGGGATQTLTVNLLVSPRM